MYELTRFLAAADNEPANSPAKRFAIIIILAILGPSLIIFGIKTIKHRKVTTMKLTIWRYGEKTEHTGSKAVRIGYGQVITGIIMTIIAILALIFG